MTNTAAQPASNDSSSRIPTTAWVQSVINFNSPKVYTVAYTSNQNISIPTGVYQIQVVCIGRGGTSGFSDDLNAGDYYSGGSGSGSGGAIASTTGPIALNQGTSLNVSFVTTDTTGYSQLDIGGNVIVKCFNGNRGGDASTNTGGGAAGAAGNTTSVTDSQYATWILGYGTVGQAGSKNNIPTSAGAAGRYIFSDGFYGCGQRHEQSAANDPPSTAIGIGAVIITYYK